MPVVNPLGVVNNASGKSRLILDLSYVDNHLRSCKFKYEGIQAASSCSRRMTECSTIKVVITICGAYHIS